MKTRNYCLLITILLGCFTMSFGQNANGCSGGLRGGTGDYYTDCWTDTGDDTTRLQAALSASPGSRLVFNESNYSINNPLTVVSHNYLVGQGAARYNDGAPESLIVLNSSGASPTSLKSIFLIGEGEREINIKDLGLEEGSGISNSAGITATGRAGYSSTGGVYISGIWFKGFTKGVNINSTSGVVWQFDSSKVTDSVFEECDNAVYVNSIGGLEITNVSINSIGNSGDGQNGVWIDVGGYIMMDYIVGNAPLSGGDRVANHFIHIGGHGVTSIRNSSSEFYKKELIIDDGGSEKTSAPVFLIANGLEGCPYEGESGQEQTIEIHNAVVVSSGNEYSCNIPEEEQIGPTRPKILGKSDVMSSGDRFCKWGSVWCNQHVDTVPNPDVTYYSSGFALEGGVSTLNSSNMVNSDLVNEAMLDLTSGFAGKPLLRLASSYLYQGVIYKNSHTFGVATDGWLEVEGNLDPPYSGYRFKKGPVQLASAVQSDLSSFNTNAGAGSMIYCSNCTPNTNPCTGSGGGALALRVGSGNWACQ
ncbi:MAG TPA: hypothetical protein VGO50_16315 [Pyrinomonadaceae bacterium]|jgi:hypothetical protein|nr:hypothetical protein [Pyrinomonadaceae bacterium]